MSKNISEPKGKKPIRHEHTHVMGFGQNRDRDIRDHGQHVAAMFENVRGRHNPNRDKFVAIGLHITTNPNGRKLYK